MLRRNFLEFNLLFIIILGLAFLAIAHSIRQNLRVGISFNYAEELKLNSQVYEKLASYYYFSHCQKEEVLLSEKEIKQNIDTTKNNVVQAISILKERKGKGKPVSSLPPEAASLLNEIEVHYNKAFSLFERLQACDTKVLKEIQEETSLALEEAKKLTPYLANAAKKSLIQLMIISTGLAVAIVVIASTFFFTISRRIHENLKTTKKVIKNYEMVAFDQEISTFKFLDLNKKKGGLK